MESGIAGAEATDHEEVLRKGTGLEKEGVARALIEKLHVYFRNQSVEKVMVMVDWNAGGLVGFFGALGFDRSNFIILEKESNSR